MLRLQHVLSAQPPEDEERGLVAHRGFNSLLKVTWLVSPLADLCHVSLVLEPGLIVYNIFIGNFKENIAEPCGP